MKTASDMNQRDATVLAEAKQAMTSAANARQDATDALAEFDAAGQADSTDLRARGERAARALEAYNAALARAALATKALARAAFEQ